MACKFLRALTYLVRIQKKMELIVKGVEEKKNKEIAQLRDEIEAEIRSEWDVYASKMVNNCWSSTKSL